MFRVGVDNGITMCLQHHSGGLFPLPMVFTLVDAIDVEMQRAAGFTHQPDVISFLQHQDLEHEAY